MSVLVPYQEIVGIGDEPVFNRAWCTPDRINKRVLLFNWPITRETFQNATGGVLRLADGRWRWEAACGKAALSGHEPSRHLAMLECEKAALVVEEWVRERYERT